MGYFQKCHFNYQLQTFKNNCYILFKLTEQVEFMKLLIEDKYNVANIMF